MVSHFTSEYCGKLNKGQQAPIFPSFMPHIYANTFSFVISNMGMCTIPNYPHYLLHIICIFTLFRRNCPNISLIATVYSRSEEKWSQAILQNKAYLFYLSTVIIQICEITFYYFSFFNTFFEDCLT